MKTIFALSLVCFFPLLHWSQEEKLDLIVADKTEDCARMMKQKCYRVQQLPSKEWTLFYDKINGFNYEEGYQYHILVTKTKKPDPVPEDLPKYTFRLDSIISVTPVFQSLQHAEWNGQYKGVRDPRFFVLQFTGSNSFHVKYNKQEAEITFKAVSGKKSYWKIKSFKWISAKPTEVSTEDLNQIFRKKIKVIPSESGEIHLMIKDRGELVFTQLDNENETKLEPTKTPMDYFNGKQLKVIQLNGRTITTENAYLVFDQHAGTFSGNNGCNQMNGRFVLTNNQLQFGTISTTRMACLDDAVAAVETELMNILRTPGLTVDFAERVMNIYNPKGELVVMLAESK